LGDNSESVEKSLSEICPHIIIKKKDKISFPLAKKSERHLVCEKLDNGGQIAVTLADE